MKRLVAIGFVCATMAAFAMPTRKDLAKAQEMVNDVTSADIKALKAGTKKPSEVAASHMALAEKASSEAEKYLLLQGAFNLYAKAGEYDSAANALEAMVRDIPEMRPDVIVEIYNKAIFRSMKDKAPRLYAIKEAARKAAANRKRLPALEKAAKAKPQDASVQKALGECQAELGNWDKALAAFAKADGKVAEIAKSESNGTAKPQDLADFWWDYDDDSSAYKLHAAAFYREALADDSFSGLARERADRRIKEIEADDGVSIANLSLASKATETAKFPAFKGGETVKLTLDAKKNVCLEFAACPPGSFEMGRHEVVNYLKVHKVELTYPFLIMKGRLTYALLTALDPKIGKICRMRVRPERERWITDDVPVTELFKDELDQCIKKLNALAAKDTYLGTFKNYEFRLATMAEWDYALWASGTEGPMMAFEPNKDQENAWLSIGYPKEKGIWMYYPLPELYVIKNYRGNAWGIHSMCMDSEPVIDTVPRPLNEDGKEPHTFMWAKNNVFFYEDSEINPVRLYKGKDARGVCRSRRTSVGGIGEKNGRLRFVYAPKLSLLNVYPRTAADGPLKSHDGKSLTPTKGAAQAKPLSFDLGSGIKLQLAHCPAGKFTMSNAPGGPDEKGTHEVKITRTYWIAPTRVTREMYKAFDADYDKDEKAKGEKKPGDFVTGRARAEAFAVWLNGKFKSKLPRGYVFRLPTEAEWEYSRQLGVDNTRDWSIEATLDTVKRIQGKKAWYGSLEVMKYESTETDPVRIFEGNACHVCRQRSKRFLVFDNFGATFRMAVGPDLLAEKK